MWLFLQIVAGVFVAFLLLILCLYLVIRWKLRGLAKSLMAAIEQGMVGGVPPFRVKLTKRSELDDEDDWVPDENRKEFESLTQEFGRLGFTRLEDYLIEELATQMRILIDADQATIGIIYCHPIANTWCEVARGYQDDTDWTYSRIAYHGLDLPPFVTHKFFPDDTVEEIVARFREDAPVEGKEVITQEEFPAIFEKSYAKEMDWRIERCGPTEEEIRRIANINGDECTEESTRQIQLQWRTAISQFYSDRVLRRHRKQAELNSFQWDHLQGYGVVVHERMGAEELLQLYDEEYYPDVLGDPTDDEEAEEMREQRDQWNRRIVELEDALTRGNAQQVFREMIELGNGSQAEECKWEFQSSVVEPVAADIWTRTYTDQEDEDWDEED